MKKILLALALVLAPSLAWGQCTGVFPSKTICGNLGGTAAPPSAWSSSGTVVGPATSTLNGLPKWGDAIGQTLLDASGTTIAGTYTWSGAQNWSSTQVFSGNNTFQTGITNFTGTFEVGGQTFTWPAAGTTVGGLGTAQTWTGNNTFNTGTVNLAGTTQLNGGAIGTVLTDNSILNNCSLAGAVAASAITISLKDASGADPSASSPCTVGFRNSTATTGTYSLVQTTGALSITAANGATLGTGNGLPFRVWTVLFNNGGTGVLGLIQTVTGAATPTAIEAIDESSTPSPTAISAGATSAATYYAASSIGNKAFRILGYFDFSSGQAAAGAWVTAPDKIQLFGPGIKKPGDTVKVVQTINNVPQSGTTVIPNDNTIPQITEGDSFITRAITPASATDILEIDATVFAYNGALNYVICGLFDADYSATNALSVAYQTTGQGTEPAAMHLYWMQRANQTTSTTLSVRCGAASSTTYVNQLSGGQVMGGAVFSHIHVHEVMD